MPDEGMNLDGQKTTAMSYEYKVIESPVGRLKLVASERGLAAVLWATDDASKRVRLDPAIENSANLILCETARQLGEYFDGRRRTFTVPLDFKGTEFQRRVWRALLSIPFSETRVYVESVLRNAEVYRRLYSK